VVFYKNNVSIPFLGFKITLTAYFVLIFSGMLGKMKNYFGNCLPLYKDVLHQEDNPKLNTL